MRNVSNHPRLPVVLCLVTMQLLCSSATKALDTLSGQALATHCIEDLEATSGRFCQAYFQGVLDTLEATTRANDQATYCVPHDLEVGGLIGLYLRESRLYPEVLGTPASRLILGMLLKFFPCLRA